ncbi:PcfJ domain-containing protein [Hymenobacter profundi]|uniref:PcfJ domain-containing protein n=1 Tax=Hymenobacter profundi TaxID=1982110 RepID=A0ABS6WVZ5_9BACT|nr:PcfJ domain-containing protein [Hymenobacter profundi]MBW3127775.1 PcfJ domain-containing protein [Hymenobacter profundi]
MANRYKPLSHEAWQAEQAVIILAASRRLDWRRWSATQQVEYLCSFNGSLPVVEAHLGAGSVLVEFYRNCLHNRSNAEQQQCRKVLLALAYKRSELLWRPELSVALAALVRFYPQRCRELAEWQPRSRNPFRQLESLVRHLFDQYGDLPTWVLNAWTANRLHDGINIADLTTHLGRGGALRTFHKLPVPLTRKLEHHLRQAPANYTFLEALRYAQLAVRNQLAWLGPVLDSRLGRGISRDDEFYLRVVDFFTAAPMVDPHQFGPVCDWIHQKRRVGIGDEPAQPSFSLKGRSMAGVLAHTAKWHRQLARARNSPDSRHPQETFASTWEPLPVPNFTGGDRGQVRITQLSSYWELMDEGSTLHHCVSSYLNSCRRGRCGIFSLTLNGVRTLTLEVLANRTIIQARGKYNRRITDTEYVWVTRWAAEARLLIPKHLFDAGR